MYDGIVWRTKITPKEKCWKGIYHEFLQIQLGGHHVLPMVAFAPKI
jgi:hypothetical protein